jgi:phosphoenolpyruvate synthase/pyruvate phosphate dikinase
MHKIIAENQAYLARGWYDDFMGSEVIWLKDATDVKQVGGKAAALARLIKGGFKVPDGFVLTEVSDQILQQFDKLGTDKVAVRSSAMAEDGAKDAWAGQLDTFLNVTRGEVLDKIRACFDSANSDRAKAYADQKKISPGKVAVIVQKMIPARVSGVAFSAHPITNDHTKVVIEAVGGLGEKLVSGNVTPDTFITDKKTAKIVERHLSGKGNLSHEQLRKITETVAKIEKLFSLPVDVEWAYAGQQLFILQSRPITTVG